MGINELHQRMRAEPSMAPIVKAWDDAATGEPYSDVELKFAELLGCALTNACDASGKRAPIQFHFYQLPSAARSLLSLMKALDDGVLS